jgi:hypothetical protein
MDTVTPAKSAPATPVRPKHKGSAQLFKNPMLERLSHTHIALPVSIFLITAVLSLYSASRTALCRVCRPWACFCWACLLSLM